MVIRVRKTIGKQVGGVQKQENGLRLLLVESRRGIENRLPILIEPRIPDLWREPPLHEPLDQGLLQQAQVGARQERKTQRTPGWLRFHDELFSTSSVTPIPLKMTKAMRRCWNAAAGTGPEITIAPFF